MLCIVISYNTKNNSRYIIFYLINTQFGMNVIGIHANILIVMKMDTTHDDY